MKQLLLLLTILSLIFSTYAQNVGIGTTTPAASAQLDVSSTTKGFLPPRMTTAQRDTIRNPEDGLIIFNITMGCPNYYYSGSWYEWRGSAANYPDGTVQCTGTPTILINVTNPITGKIWMDRNLGASQVAKDSNDTKAFGDLYQWGRRADGHQCRTSTTTNALSSADQPANGNFITVSSSPFDWRSPQNTNLWQGVEGINNPCPSGFRLPSDAELDEERQSWSSQNSTGAFNSPLKLPKAGIRSSSTGAIDVGNRGTYWSATISGNNSRSLFFGSTTAGIGNSNRALGFSVRCIKNIVGSIATINCGAARNIGTLTPGAAANGVIIRVPYTGGNSGIYNGQSVNSTGVTGLTATLTDGSFVNGNDSLTYTITGTPASIGTASFAISVSGQSCTLTFAVNAPAYPEGTVHCSPASPTAVVDIISTTGKIWMDRNLGASQVAASISDAAAYGDLYQWGRRADGHQCRTSATTNILSSTDQPSHGDFIVSPTAPADWRSGQNVNLWQGVNGLNNPCPAGYRLPTEAELNTERQSWNFGNVYFPINGAFASPLKLPNPGIRSDGTGAISQTGTVGTYWTSTVSNTSSRALSIPIGLNAIYNTSFMVANRAAGYSVRCLKEVVGTIATLNCGLANNTGTLTSGTAANGVSSSVPYTGGNAGTHSGQIVNSTGVTGLTATLLAGSFTNGNGSLTYAISGTPTGSGTANFAVNIGGQTCTLTLTVYTAGTIFCSGSTTTVVNVTSTTGKVWMDRNLGASQTATSSTDANAYGDLYQWGRRTDGHQCRTSANTSTLSSTDLPAHGDFILAPNDPADWRTPQNSNLWQGVNGVNNPCPGGYRLPTETELNAELQSWGNQNSVGAFDSPLKLPMAGSRGRSTGLLNDVGARGLYWTTTISGGSSRSLSYFSNSATMFTSSRGVGASVRCIKDVVGTITTLNCNAANNTGTLEQGKNASGVSSSVPYEGGDGGAYSGQVISSTGVTGLTATLTAGSFLNGNGVLTYNITGMPASIGTASFALTIGGKNCTISFIVYARYPNGTVHCSGTPTAVVDVTSVTGKIWMDRNLGASQVAAGFDDSEAFGDLYQWGRRSDGHQCRTSTTTTVLSSTDLPAHGNFIVSPYDWRSPSNPNLWQGANGVNNPCPNGYRLPTAIEWNNERLSWSDNTAVGALSSPLKLLMAGARKNSDGLINANYGFYWSSTVSNEYPDGIRSITFDLSGSEMVIDNPAWGLSVRCIKN
jgi:uncharacterized protein (TIGR02145 family)